MAGPKIIPSGFQHWPAQASQLAVDDVIKMYEGGFAGAYAEPQERDELRAMLDVPDAAFLTHLTGSGEGKLSIPFIFVEQIYGKEAYPGPAQSRGDCVSHSAKNACLVSLCCEVVAGQPDPVTGQLEGAPEVSPEGIKNGVLSSESVYWWRRHGSDGWSCPASVKVMLQESGCAWPRRNYDEIGVDVTQYSGGVAGKWGSSTPPETVKGIGNQHLIRTATECGTFEECRDLLANGYGITGCGSEGWSKSRDENGVSNRSGSWAHSMAVVGADDRDVIKAKYGGPLLLIINSWGKWNSGGRRILGTEIDIPEGSYWAKWSDCDSRYHAALSSVNGWPARRLPDYGANF